MGVREKIEKHKFWLMTLCPVLVIASVGYCVWTLRAESHLEGPIDQAYFSDDDGKTYFADSIEKAMPFDHNGKKAYRAYVFTCENETTPFVGLLGRDGKAQPVSANNHYAVKEAQSQIEVKKPGTDKWVLFMSPDGQKLLQSVCPSGHPVSVQPGQ
jgi:hypothetical protein